MASSARHVTLRRERTFSAERARSTVQVGLRRGGSYARLSASRMPVSPHPVTP